MGNSKKGRERGNKGGGREWGVNWEREREGGVEGIKTGRRQNTRNIRGRGRG